MKKIINKICMWATLFVVAATALSCEKEDATTPEAKTFTMTVNATKGGRNAMKQLTLDGHTLNATWAVGDSVTVYNVTKGAALTGTLKAQSAGASTTLSGTLTGVIEDDDQLKLTFLGPDYGTQDGTLTGSETSIDKVCDYAEATVTAFVNSSGVTTLADAEFENKQAIVKFTLRNFGNISDVNVSRLTVRDGTNTYNVTPASATGTLYVAIPAITSGTLTLTAVGTDKPYKYERTGVTFEAGRYYEITVGMSVNLDSISSDITLQNGDKVVGGYEGNNKVYKVSIAADATVTLDGMRINGYDIPYVGGEWAGLTCLGDATINLIGTNDVKGFDGRYPGLFVPSGSTLTIQGSGSLEARSNGRGAGIGGVSKSIENDPGIDCGNIVITGGTIDAHSPSGTAIGSGLDASCGNITITPGVTRVKASRGGGDASDCIGQGAGGGSCGTVTIGLLAGRISGSSFTYPTTIDVGSLTADYVARYGDTLTGTRTSGHKVSVCAGGNVTINNLNISGCPDAGLTCLGTATITLNGTNSLTGETGFPGIFVPSASTLTIQGNGSLNAATNGNAVSRAAGIGGGDAMDCGDIVITGGNITATGGYNCAGIGGGYHSGVSGLHAMCGNITISGGTIVATGGESAAGIGGGYNSPCGVITITTGVTSVTATRGGTYSDVIGRGFGNFRDCNSVEFGNATVFNGTAWSPDPMVAGTYGGLTLAISNSGNTWTLTPSSK